jgi:hypothetical protein
MRQLDLRGAFVATAIFAVGILISLSRLTGLAAREDWLGVTVPLTVGPPGYLLFKAPGHHRSSLYCVPIGLMLAYLAFELVLDYLLKRDVHRVRWMSAARATLFVAGTAGMIGIASAAGRRWAISSVVLVLIMGALVFATYVKHGT